MKTLYVMNSEASRLLVPFGKDGYESGSGITQ